MCLLTRVKRNGLGNWIGIAKQEQLLQFGSRQTNESKPETQPYCVIRSRWQVSTGKTCAVCLD